MQQIDKFFIQVHIVINKTLSVYNIKKQMLKRIKCTNVKYPLVQMIKQIKK